MVIWMDRSIEGGQRTKSQTLLVIIATAVDVTLGRLQILI